jgi:hypothetical protein
MNPEQIMISLSKFCFEVWEAGDGCPLMEKNVKKKFQLTVLPKYNKYRKGDIDDEAFKKKNKKKKKKDPESSGSSDSEKSVSTRGPSRYSFWLRDHGNRLFDIFSVDTMRKYLEEGKAFDSEFYEDQKDVNKRNLVIQTMRVRKEFYEQEKELEMSKARKYAHKLSAFGLNMPNQTSTVDLDDTPHIEDENIEDSPFKAPRDENLISKRINRSSTVTRSTVSRSLESQIDNILILPASINTTTDEGTQTENLFLEEVRESAMPQISTRKKPTKKRF